MYLRVLFLAVSGLPVLVFVIWPFTSVYDEKLAEVRERHLLIAQHLGRALELYHKDIIVAMETFAPLILQGEGEKARPILEHLNFYHLCVVDRATGEVVQTLMGENDPCPSQVPMGLVNALIERSSDGSVALGGVVIPPGLTPRIRVSIISDGTLIVGAIGTKYFIQLQREVQFGENGHSVILDQNGLAIAHPSPVFEREARSMASFDIVKAMMRGESGVETFYSPLFDEDMIAGYTTVPGIGWGVMVPQPLVELAVSAETFNREVAFILLLGLAAALLIAHFLGRSISYRIEIIQSHVDHIANGAKQLYIPPNKRKLDIKNFVDLETGVLSMFADLKKAQQNQDTYSEQLEENNARLQKEINTRIAAENVRNSAESRYLNLFENIPVAVREEDLSQIKDRIDGLNISDARELRRYLSANPEFVAECGRAVRIVDANAAALALHGYSDKEKFLARVTSTLGPESLKFIQKVIVSLFEGRTRETSETVIYQSDGKPRHLITTWYVIPGYENDYSRSLLTSVDITAKVEAEQALKQSQKMEAIGQLTGGIAHDFNNLLMVIHSNAELLESRAKTEDDFELIKPIISSAERGAELTQRLLAFSRKQPLKPSSVDLMGLINGMIGLLGRSLGPQYDIAISGDPNLCRIYADPGQVEGAFLNLAINARDAMPDGGRLEIRCRNCTPEELDGLDLIPGNYAVLSVKDNGSGMPADVLSRIFEPFFTTKPVGKGSGLGLSMVYGFCRQSNGDVLVESTLGQGTEFKLILPCANVRSRVQQVVEQPIKAPKSLNILLLDDSEVVQIVTAKVLESLGHRVRSAISIAEAWQLIDEDGDIDLIVSDVLLPGTQSGPDFARDYWEKNPDCPIIFLSGYTADHETASDLKEDKSIWLTKPCRKTEFAKAINTLCADISND